MRIGIIGGGQLGRMIALAAYPLGARVTFLEPAPDAPMSFLAKQICGAYDNEAALDELAQTCDVVTYEFENVPVAAAERVAQSTPIYPPPAALRVSQDRWQEKSFFQALGIPTPAFMRVDSLDALQEAVAEVGLPAVLKTRRMGYDGKGQLVLSDRTPLADAWSALGKTNLILEAFVNFTREVSLLATRSKEGTYAFYPLVENHHAEGILRLSLAPAPDLSPALQAQAERYAKQVLDTLQYVGVVAIEFFQVGQALWANEMAPRVHNSGHWTIEGAVTSQFENHARAVMGLPLGSAAPRGACAMLNLIGTLPETDRLLEIPDAHVHLYDKAPRAGRKLGHVTLVARDAESRAGVLAQAIEILQRAATDRGTRVPVPTNL